MEIKKKSLKSICGMFGFLLYCISSLFQDYITTRESSILLYFVYFFTIALLIYSLSRQGCLLFQKKNLNFLTLWIVLAAVFVIGHNEALRHSSYFTTIRWLYFFFILIVISYTPKERYPSMLKIIGGVAGIYVTGVYFFLIFPEKYSMMYNQWGYWPTGTNGGTLGFRAGYASHYSENGMFISLVIFVIVSFLLTETKKLKKNFQLVLFFTTVIALMLTTKRAHLLFGFFAIAFTYYIYRPEKRSSNGFKIIIGSAMGLMILYISSFFIPIVSEVFKRFSSIGEDSESMTRFSMWALALHNFIKNPFLGIGWNGYKYQFFQYLYDPRTRAERYAFLNAHNVYLQLLAETGFIGFSLFIGGAIKIFSRTIVILSVKYRDAEPEIRAVLLFSIIVQTFFFLYCLTGNCLYDSMFSFFALATGIAIGCCCQKNI